MKRISLVIAAMTATAMFCTAACADDLTFNTRNGEVTYTENKEMPADISVDDLVKSMKTNQGRDTALNMDLHGDIGMQVGDADSGIKINMMVDLNAAQESMASGTAHSRMDMQMSFLGEYLYQIQEDYTWKDDKGAEHAFKRESDDQGNLGEWEEGYGNAFKTSDIAEAMKDMRLLDNVYQDEQGLTYYVCQMDIDPKNTEGVSGDMAEGLGAATDSLGIDLTEPVTVSAMFRTSDCTLSRAYMDMSELKGEMDGALLGSDTSASFNITAMYLTLAVDDLEEDVTIPEELKALAGQNSDDYFPETDASPVSDEALFVKIAGTEYQVPGSVEDMLANGWAPDWEYSGGKKLGAKEFGFIKLNKGERTFTAYVYNNSDEQINAENGIIYELSMLGFDGNDDVEILDGTVRMGMSESDMKAALETAGIPYEEDEDNSGSDNRYYYINSDPNHNAGYEIGADEMGIWKIDVKNENIFLN